MSQFTDAQKWEYYQHMTPRACIGQDSKAENQPLVNAIENDLRYWSERKQILKRCAENMRDLDSGEYGLKFKQKKDM